MAERSPTSLRTSRNRALEIGTTSAGFTGSEAGLCARPGCSQPPMPGMQHGHAADNTSSHARAGTSNVSRDPVPFTVTKGSR